MQPNKPASATGVKTTATTTTPATANGTTEVAAARPAAAAQTPAPPRELEQRVPGPDRRNSVVDRRVGMDRRQQTRDEAGYGGPERRVAKADRRDTSGLERRRGPGRRRSDDRKAAEEGEMTNEQFEFCMAIETYKKVNKKMYPTWTEVLEVIRHLGYRKVQARDIKLENCPEPELFKLDDLRNADAA
jgi:hypothetical protein